MAFGLTPAGFIPYTLADRKAWWENKLRAIFGASVRMTPETVFGQWIAALSEADEEIYLNIERYYATRDPNQAFGVILDALMARNGLQRFSATRSVVKGVALIGDEGTLVSAGHVFSVIDSPETRFATQFSVQLGAGADEAQYFAFSAVPTSGEWVVGMDGGAATLLWNETADSIKAKLQTITSIREVTVSGNFSGGFIVKFTGPSGKVPRNLFTVNSSLVTTPYAEVGVSVSRITAGAFQATVDCEAVVAGSSYNANAWTLRKIDTTGTTGLKFIDNPSSAIVGKDAESDAEAKERRSQTLSAFGSSTVEAIRSAVESVSTEIAYCRVFENENDVVVNTWKPHSVAIYVHQDGGKEDHDMAIATAIFKKKGAGIGTNGPVERTVYDSKGYPHVIRFYRAIGVPVWIEISLATDSNFPEGGEDAIKDILVANGNKLGAGKSVIVHPTLESWIAGVSGITDLTVRIGRAANPTTDNNLIISDGTNGLVEFSMWDATRITVNK